MAAESLLRSLLALPELGMRIKWFERRLQCESSTALAPSLNHLAERAQCADPRAREGLVALAIFLAQQHDTSLPRSLRIEAQHHALLSLERLVRRGLDEPLSIKVEDRVPDYGTGRELSVGERRSLARRPSRLDIERLLLDPHPLVLEPLFQCSTLTEEDIIQIATRRPARITALELLAHSLRWMARRRVRLSLILNPSTPHGLALPLVSTCRREDLTLLVSSANLSRTLRSVAHELHSRLPPLQGEFSNTAH